MWQLRKEPQAAAVAAERVERHAGEPGKAPEAVVSFELIGWPHSLVFQCLNLKKKLTKFSLFCYAYLLSLIS
jgi:hypothetical protein